MLNITPRVLMGPGPSNGDPQVLQAMALPTIGHLDPDFIKIMEDIKTMLRQVMLTENELTIPVSGTGSAGMEAALCNLIEPGDRCVVCVNGVFGGRMADVCGRYGGEVVKVTRPGDSRSIPTDVRKAVAGGGDQAGRRSSMRRPPPASCSRWRRSSQIAHEAGALLRGRLRDLARRPSGQGR